MKFFFPDNSDHVDPTFDFLTETRSRSRIRQRDDVYAHELFHPPPYDGLLISKSIVERGMTRYTEAQRHRLFREGASRFFRTDLPILGDCGAFSYVREEEPPFGIDEVLHFYTECRVHYGISVDHLILDYEPSWDDQRTFDFPGALADARRRQAITLESAEKFFLAHVKNNLRFTPLGVAQGWSPASYAFSVRVLEKLGYAYIAVGGLVPLKTYQIVEILKRLHEVRKPTTRFHLLGVTRCDQIHKFASLGVASFDSTSPLRQAFKDMKDNYYTVEGSFPAIRVPQVDANITLKRRIGAGLVSQTVAMRLERACLEALLEYDRCSRNLDEVVDLLRQYEHLCEPKSRRAEDYRRVLEARPWKHCDCDVCRNLGIHVILFRGAERNRRRGFHNLWAFRKRLERQLSGAPGVTTSPSAPTASVPDHGSESDSLRVSQ